MVKKLITLDGLAVFLSELRKEINAGAGKCFDAEELARRIPSWQWKVTLPKTQFGIITATVGGVTMAKSEKDKEVSFYAPQGSVVKFAIEQRYKNTKAEEMSVTEVALTSDFALTVKGGGKPAGKLDPGDINIW